MDKAEIEIRLKQNKDDQHKLQEEHSRLKEEFRAIEKTYSVGDTLVDSYHGDLKIIGTVDNCFSILVCTENRLWLGGVKVARGVEAKDLYRITQSELDSFTLSARGWRKE